MDTPNTLNNLKKDAGSLLLNPRFIGPCMAGIFCLIVATVVGVTYLFTMATILLVLPIASYLVGIFILRKCRCTRDAQMLVTQEERAALSIALRGLPGSFHRGLSIQDRRSRMVDYEPEPEPVSASDEQIDYKIWITAKKRGVYTLGPADIVVSDPLGMIRLRRKMQSETELIVFPKPIRFRLGTPAGASHYGRFNQSSGRLGASGDFAGTREYRYGDELRRIHWKSTAHTQKLVVKELEESSVRDITVILDLSQGCDFGDGPVTALDVAIGAATFVIESYLSAGLSVRLLFANDPQIKIVTVCDYAGLTATLRLLAEVEAKSDLSIGSILRTSHQCQTMVITSNPEAELCDSVQDATSKGASVSVALIDPEPFGIHTDIRSMATMLERAGAQVELVQETTR